MVVCDAVLRKLPGALGHADSALEESFSAALDGAPEYPHYTRPAEYRGWRVPDVLLSGHHARIREWRLEQSAASGVGATSAVRYHRRPAQAHLALCNEAPPASALGVWPGSATS